MWCRWGRVGENGACLNLGPFSTEPEASKTFAKKFREKTANKWQVSQGGSHVGLHLMIVGSAL